MQIKTKISLEGNHALVTGGTNGIGFAIARSFLEAGSRVTLFSRKEENAQKAADSLASFSHNLLVLNRHVAKSDQMDALIADSEKKFGEHSILVNNAATNPYLGPIVDSSDSAWRKTLEVNLDAPYRLSRILGKKMAKNKKGVIINISSVAGVESLPYQGIYSVSKAALNMLTKVFARELGPFGVRVNAIMPGVIETKMSEMLWKDPNEPVSKMLKERTALGRFGKPEEVAALAVYLASDACSFVSGAIIPVDGYLVG